MFTYSLRTHLSFMHQGALPHFLHAGYAFSTTYFHNNGQDKVDQSFLSFKLLRLLWVHLNISVCGTEVTDVQQLQHWIHIGFERIHTTPEIS